MTASLAFPQVAHTVIIKVFRPFRRERLFATLGAFIQPTWGTHLWNDAIGVKRHGTFLTRLRALHARRFLTPDPNFYPQKTHWNSQAELELITAKPFRKVRAPAAIADIVHRTGRSYWRNLFGQVGRNLVEPVDDLGIAATLGDEAG